MELLDAHRICNHVLRTHSFALALALALALGFRFRFRFGFGFGFGFGLELELATRQVDGRGVEFEPEVEVCVEG